MVICSFFKILPSVWISTHFPCRSELSM
uniref:Uncharacterized protein n=1 Tax=Anguilla anguilla TaxID=7936 RepID=A0A0E9V5K7_ANGAN